MNNEWGVETYSSYINLESPSTSTTLTNRTSDNSEWDLVIVGGGGSGTSCARESAARGMRVLMLQGERGGGGAAGANAGFLLCGGSLFYHDAEETWGGAVSLALWHVTKEEIQNQRAMFGDVIKQTGSQRTPGLDDDGSESQDIRKQFLSMRDAGLNVEIEERNGVATLRVPEDGWCDPVERLAHGWREVTKNGGHIETAGTVKWRKKGDSWMIDTQRREIKSRRILIASDAHLESQIPKLSGAVQTHRLQMLRASKPAAGLDVPSYMRWGFDYGVNHAGKLHLGGFRDRHRLAETHGEWRGRCGTSATVQRDLETLATKLCQEECSVEWRWAAPVGYTPSGLPIAGEIEPGMWVAGGYNGHGNLISWILGREIAQEMTGSRGRLLGMIGR